MSNEFKYGRALVVGVANYPLVSKLSKKVLDDARDIEAILKSQEYCAYPSNNVKLLLDEQATAAGIRQGLRELAHAAGNDDTVVVFFSGHGGRVETGPDFGTYLIPFDCDRAKLKETAIGADELTRLLSEIKAGRLVVLLDACHAAGAGEVKALEPAFGLKSGLDEKTYALLAKGVGRVILASCRSTEVSLILQGMRNSLFTHYLLEALSGAAHVRNDGMIRVFEVFHYVSDKVPAKAAQHPIFKAQDLETNFPLAMDRGGKSIGPATANAPTGAESRPASLSGKARLEIRRGIVTRWTDLADYLEVPLADRSTFGRGSEAASRLLDWLEERSKLGALRDAFNYLGWDDLIAILPSLPGIRQLSGPSKVEEADHVEWPFATVSTPPDKLPPKPFFQGQLDAGTWEEEIREKDFPDDNPYLLGEKFEGRERELTDLTDWLADKDPLKGSRVLCISDFGGSGKSAIAFHWLNSPQTEALRRDLGFQKFWATFYARNYGWFQFLLKLAARVGVDLELMSDDEAGLGKLLEAILKRLREKPWLIVLDGLEREMGAYANLENEQIDAEAQDRRYELEKVPEDERYVRHPVFRRFLRSLCNTKAKVLITSRIFPEDLRVEGVDAHIVTIYPFRPLSLSDARRVWQLSNAQVLDSEFQSEFFRLIDYHPQVIAIVSAAVAGSRGFSSFEEWFSNQPDLLRQLCQDESVPKTTRRYRWLELATRDIVINDRKSWTLLCQIVRRTDVSHVPQLKAALVASGVSRFGDIRLFASDKELDRSLDILVERRLTGLDRARSTVDVHPVVRGLATKHILKNQELGSAKGDEELLNATLPGGGDNDLYSKVWSRKIEELVSLLDNQSVAELSEKLGDKFLLDLLAKSYPQTDKRFNPWLFELPIARLRKDQARILFVTGSVLTRLGRWDEALTVMQRDELAYRLCGDLASADDCRRFLEWQSLYGGSLRKCEEQILKRLESQKDDGIGEDYYWLALLLAIRQSEAAEKLLNVIPHDTNRWTRQAVAEAYYYLEKYGESFELMRKNVRLMQEKEELQISTHQLLWEWVTLGLSALRVGQPNAASRWLEQAIERGAGIYYPIIPMFARAGYIEVLFESAMVLKREQKPAAVQQELNEAMRLYLRQCNADPVDRYQIPASEAHLTAAKIHYELGERPEAIVAATRALKAARGKDPFRYAAGEKRALEFLGNLEPPVVPSICPIVVDQFEMLDHESRIANLIREVRPF